MLNRFALLIVLSLACGFVSKIVAQDVDVRAGVYLTNVNVIELYKSGKSENEILEVIEQSGVSFDLSENGITLLRNAGIPDNVIAAMDRLQKRSGKNDNQNANQIDNSQESSAEAMTAPDLSFRSPTSNGVVSNNCHVGEICAGSDGNRHSGEDYSYNGSDTFGYSVNFGVVRNTFAWNTYFGGTCGGTGNSHCMGNVIAIEHLLTSGRKLVSVAAHFEQRYITGNGQRISSGQRIGKIGNSGATQYQWGGGNPTVNRHVHLELRLLDPAYNSLWSTLDQGDKVWPYGYMDQSEANYLRSGDQTITIQNALARAFRTLPQIQNEQVLIPYFSATASSPNSTNYDVYGIANQSLNSSITLTTPSPTGRTINNFGVGGRLWTNQNVNRDIFNVPSATFANGQTQTFSGSRSDLSSDDYRFFAYANYNPANNQVDNGYPVKFSILPNTQSKIVDNDSLTGFSIGGSYENVAGYYLSAKLFTGGNSGNFAEWRPTLGTCGGYEIYVHVPDLADVTNVSYVLSPDGTSIINSSAINHAGNNDKWVRLTSGAQQTFQFTSNGYVRLDGQAVISAQAGKKIGVDAVKFICPNPGSFGDFTIVSNVTGQTIQPGASAQYLFSTSTTNGSPQNINLSVSGLPQGATYTISQPTITTGQPVTVTVTTSPQIAGKGNSSTLVTPTGNYTLTLSGSGTVTRSTSAGLTITNIPSAVISMSGNGQTGGNNQTLNYTVPNAGSVQMTFSGVSSTPVSGTITAYEWRSNGTVISNLPTFSFPFAAASHTITLKVTDSTGLSNTATATIVVTSTNSQSPQAIIGMNSGGQSGGNGQTLVFSVASGGSINMSFNATGSTAGTGTLTNYEWRSNNSVISTQPSFSFPFGIAQHDISLKVTNSSGLTNTATARIIVNDTNTAGPQAVISMNGGGQSGGNGQTLSYTVNSGGSISMNFSASGSTPGGGTISNYEWRSNGSLISNLPSFSFPFGIASHTITLKVTNTAGLSNTATSTIVVSSGSAPVISSIAPSSPIATAINQSVTVNGTGFQSGLTVTVVFPGGGQGTLSGSQIQSVTANSFIMLINFNNVPGSYSIKVNNPGGAQSNSFGFGVQGAVPVISSILPSSPVAIAGNQNVTVNGSNFVSGLTVTVTFPNGSTGTLSGSQIGAITSASFVMAIDFNNVPGAYSIRVNNPGGIQSNNLGFTVQPQATPSISSISPLSPIATAGNQNVTVNGSNFVSGLTVRVTFPNGSTGTLSGSQITSVTPTSFVMVIDFNNVPGAYSIRVNNPGGAQSNNFGFTVQAQPTPSITSIVPSSPVATVGNQNVTVNGSNFVTGLTVTVTFPNGTSGTLSGSQITSVTPTSFVMVIDFNNVPGAYSIRVNNPGGTQSNSFGFSVQPQATPSITSISPLSPVATVGNQNVTVNGTNFVSGLTVTVTFPNGSTGTLSGSQITNVTSSSFVMVIDFNNVPGAYSIRVNNPGGSQSNNYGFSVQPAVPLISSISPSSPIATVGNQNVTVIGQRFVAGLTVTVTFPNGSTGTLSGSQITSVTSTSFVMVINFNNVPGAYSIRVNNPGGAQSNNFGFTVQAQPTPSISSISPSSPIATVGNQNVTVNGSNFVSGLTVTVTFPNGSTATLSGSQILSVTPSSFVMVINFNNVPGAYSIRVNNPGGTQSNNFGFTVQTAIPQITSISPASPPRTAGNQNVTVNGQRFVSGLTVTVTFPGGGTGTLSGSQITSVTSTSFIMIINFNNVPGSYSIRVNNPGGAQSNTFGFTVQ